MASKRSSAHNPGDRNTCPFCPPGSTLWPAGCEHVLHANGNSRWAPDIAPVADRAAFLLQDWLGRKAYTVGTPWTDLVKGLPYWQHIQLAPSSVYGGLIEHPRVI